MSQLDVLQGVFTYERAIVVTPYSFGTTLIPVFLGYYVMAVLVQLPHARLYKVSLLPVVFWMTFQAGTSLDFSCGNPKYAYRNKGLALSMFTIAMRSTVWTFTRQPYTRLPTSKSMNGTAKGGTPTEHVFLLPSAMWNAWDLVANLRCIGWNGPSNRAPIPAPYFQVESRRLFALLSLCRLIPLVLALDIMCAYVQSLGSGTFATSEGGTIFDPSLPIPERYLKSSLITALHGVIAYIVVEAAYQAHAMLFTIIFCQYPSQWPPVFDSPWLSTSLASLWARRWQQCCREFFVGVGSKPAEKCFGRVGTIMGAFAISGVFHNVGLQGIDRGGDALRVVGFFLMQGIGIILERTWRLATGRRVGGVIGWLWTFSWLLFWGHFIVDAWAKKGLLGSEFFSDARRPTLLFLNLISG